MGELGVSDIFLYFSLALVLLWTVRLARSKGKNPFLWGGIAFLLMLIPDWPALLGMGPMILLLFLKAPQKPAEEAVQQESVTCPKCRAYHALGHTYCVNCGWELNRPYTESGSQPTETNVPPKPQIEQKLEQPLPVEAIDPVASVDSTSVEPTPDTVSAEEPAAEESNIEVEEVPVPVPPKPVETRPVTPERFTQQGLDRLDERHTQEAIDQFTKALALDPSYIPALENRAKTYRRQGRKDKAAEDQQLLEALQRESASK